MKNRLETRVGLFFVLAALAAVLMLEVSDNSSFFGKTYVLYADFDNVNELKEGDPVKLAGVQIGRVESITLEGGEIPENKSRDDNETSNDEKSGGGSKLKTVGRRPVRVKLRIDLAHKNRIPTDSAATIKFTGLMGQHFVSIKSGHDSVVMKPGSLLKSQEMANLNTMLTTMNNLAGGIEAVTDSFKGVKIDSIVGPMSAFLKANTNRMYNIVGNMESISGQLAEGNGTVSQLLRDEQLYNSLNQTVANMERISGLVAGGDGTVGKLIADDALYQQLDTIAKDFGRVSADLISVSDKIAKGEGTLGKLVHDDKLYTLLNTTADDFSVVAADLKSVTAKVAKGEGTVGKLLHEDELYNSLNATAKTLEHSSAKVDKLVDNTNTLVTDVRSSVDTVSDAATAAKSVLTKVDQGKGTLGKLVNDEAVYSSLEKSAQSLENTTAKAEALIDDASGAVATAQSVLSKVDQGEGTLGKLVNQDVLYAETTEAMKNLREIVQKINRGEGTVGMLVNDDSLFKNARATLQKVDNATETMEDQGPISVIGLMFNGLF